MNIALFGLSGIGDPTIQILIRAFRKRLKKVLLIDPDKWEKDQLYKTILSATHKVGVPKVNISKALIKKVYPDLKVVALNTRIQEVDPSRFNDIDILVGCVDNDGTRIYAQLLCAEKKKTFLDMSAQITAEGRMATIRLYMPNKTPCLFCQGLKPNALMTESLRSAKQATGYLDPEAKQDLGSIALLDTAAACIGITHLELHLQNAPQKKPSTLSYHQEKHKIKQLYFESKTNCPICGEEKIKCRDKHNNPKGITEEE